MGETCCCGEVVVVVVFIVAIILFFAVCQSVSLMECFVDSGCVQVRAAPDELEDDYLDMAWGLEPDSRLSCQAIVADEDLVVEIPRYTINMVSERH